MNDLPPIAAVKSALAAVRCAPTEPAAFAGAVIRGLVAPAAPVPDLVHIADALDSGVARVKELDPPEVARLEFQHTGLPHSLAVFVPAGTLVKGGGQNRIVALSTLLQPGETRALEVRCVEHGRWNPNRFAEFTSTSSAPSWLKAAKQSRDTDARIDRRGVRAADQRETWADVTLHLSLRGVRSRTESLFDAIDPAGMPGAASPASEPFPEHLAGAAGAWVQGDTTTGEVFLSPGLRKAGVRGVVESASRDRAASHPAEPRPERWSFEAARDDLLASAEWRETPVPGGVIVDVRGRFMVGSAFVGGGRVVHLSLVGRR